jgi:DNA-binding transcriptional ArsR family regulator
MAPERETLGLDAIRLLAHPLRQRIERELRRGPVTATSLAKALGESTGLTSYHLRQLARYGFVEEVPELARGRERWWRFVPKDRRFPRRSEQGPELRAVMDEMLRRDAEADLTGFARAQAGAEDGPWADAFPFSRGSIDVTLEELKDFFEEYIALLYKYRRPERETPPGARRVFTRFFAYPAPDEPGATPEEYKEADTT